MENKQHELECCYIILFFQPL